MSTLRRRLYNEVEVGGYTRADTTIDFFSRVNALLDPDMQVVDLGAGRGKFMDDAPWFRRDLQNLRGKVQTVIGLDVDPVVLDNPSVDEAHLLGADGAWPLSDSSVDLVVSDWTFEHVTNPRIVGAEAARTVRDGGWVCARTPNRWGYIAASSRLVPDKLHAAVLARAQPRRQSRDVFPTRYALNTVQDVRAAFPEFEVFHYSLFGEPAYFGQSVAAWRAVQSLHRVLPNALAPVSLFFLRRKAREGTTASAS